MKRRARILCAASAALLALGAGAGCDLNKYCIDCAAGDGGAGGDGGAFPPDADFLDAAPVGDACVSSGVEQCDGMDNDCDGEVDEGDLTGVGAPCGTDVGACVAGVTECAGGEIVCGGDYVEATPEECNGEDDDCDGEVDNGNPGGGTVCGTDQGECVSGLTMCVDGAVECVGNSGGDDEACNGLDDDCDGNFDEGDPGGGAACGTSDQGLCTLGTETCLGGQIQCVGATHPEVEQCDDLDHDCDGADKNGFDLMNDVKNCGACGHDCNDDPAPAGENALVECSMGQCAIATCETDYWDLNGDYGDGCEYGPCVFQGAAEACNAEDDDCDGAVDEDLTPPDICDQDGACSGTVATCTASGWECIYGADVDTDGDGNIVPETRCDGLDNDCDGKVDESFPLLGEACDDGELGVCRGTGTFVCNADEDGVTCNITDPGQTASAETCNNLDDDCNGDVDENIASLSAWVDIGGVEIMAYEASRPDADAASAGLVEDRGPCAKPNALPWTNLTYPEAEAACQAIGARLCTEAEWELACKSPIEAQGSPAPQDPGPSGVVILQAEDFDNQFVPSASENTWEPDSTAGFTGSGALRALPDDGDNNDSTSEYLDDSPRLDYDIDFTHTGTHYVWIRGYHTDNLDNSIHAGLDESPVSTANRIENYKPDEWSWTNVTRDGGSRATIDVPSTGVHTLNLWMRETGFRIDKVILTTDASYSPRGVGLEPGQCLWSYETDCLTYQPNTCNGNDYDTDDATAGDQDDVLPTGELAACFADWAPAGEVHDLSGNVKEWAEARSAGVNPIRGGASNNTETGISCSFDFTVADDAFAFPNVGFRCCR